MPVVTPPAAERPRLGAPLAPGWPLLGSLLDIRRDPIGTLRSASRYGDVVRLEFPRQTAFLVSDPELVKRVFVDAHDKYGKQTRGYDALRLSLGQGLLTSEGALWRRQRRLAQPAFHPKRIGRFHAVMVGAVGDLLERWARLPAGAVVDVAAEMMALTLRIVGQCLLSTDLSSQTDVIGKNLTIVLEDSMDRITRPLALPLSVPTAANRRLQRAMAEFDRMIGEIIRARRAARDRPDDLLTTLLESEGELGESMDERQLRDEIATLVAAGHETTANALTWTFYLLSEHPEVRAEVEAEVDRALGGRAPAEADLERLVVTLAAFKESLRIYPPAWSIARSADEDDWLGPYFIPRGSLVFVPPIVLHASPKLWRDPERFDPARFSPGGEAERLPRFAYFPFGGGPRVCIGSGFANLEALIALAMIAGRFRLTRVPDQRVELEPLITLRPRHGMRMTLAPRSLKASPAS